MAAANQVTTASGRAVWRVQPGAPDVPLRRHGTRKAQGWLVPAVVADVARELLQQPCEHRLLHISVDDQFSTRDDKDTATYPTRLVTELPNSWQDTFDEIERMTIPGERFARFVWLRCYTCGQPFTGIHVFDTKDRR